METKAKIWARGVTTKWYPSLISDLFFETHPLLPLQNLSTGWCTELICNTASHDDVSCIERLKRKATPLLSRDCNLPSNLNGVHSVELHGRMRMSFLVEYIGIWRFSFTPFYIQYAVIRRLNVLDSSKCRIT